jgi:hypothetical protein
MKVIILTLRRSLKTSIGCLTTKERNGITNRLKMKRGKIKGRITPAKGKKKNRKRKKRSLTCLMRAVALQKQKMPEETNSFLTSISMLKRSK